MGGALLGGERIQRERVPDVVYKFLGRYSDYIDEHIICGSYRRGKKDVGDIDIVVNIDPTKQLSFGMQLQKDMNVPWRYVKKSVLIDGVQLEVNLCLDVSYLGAMVMYATGSGGFNSCVRLRAAERGLKLNRYGLWKGGIRIAGRTEESIFTCLGMPFIRPEDRK